MIGLGWIPKRIVSCFIHCSNDHRLTAGHHQAPHESSPPQPLPGPLAESSTVLPSQQVPGLFTNDRPQPEHSDALGVVSKDVSSPPGPKDDHKKNLFPGLQRPILAAAAAKILRAVPENAGKTIRPHDILTVLDENTSYVGLCEVLEAKGFLLNRVYFARALVLAINKERAQKSSTVTADMPTASVASASASTSGSRRQGQTSGDTISRTHPSFPETRQTTRLTASSHQAGTGQLAFVSSTKGGGEPGSASQAALQVSPISGSHQGVSLGQKGPSRGSVPAHHILSSQQATPFPAKPRVEERDAASGSEKARKRSHAEVIEIDDSGSEPESVRSAEAVKPKDASQETKRAAMTSSGLSRGHGKHANVEAVAPARPDPQVARSGSTQVPLASRLRNEAFVSPMKFKDATRRSDFNTRTIARDVLLATGRHPTLSSLNDHLTVATKNLPQMSPTWDLSTFRWDLVDPGGPPSQTSLPAAHGADKSNHTDTARSDHFSQFVYSPRKTPDLAQLPPQMDGASSFDSRSGTHGHARKNVVSGRPAALTSKASDKTSRVRASNSPTARQAASHDQVLPNPSRKRSREPEPEIDSRRSPRMSKLASGSPDPEPGQVLPIHTVSFAKPSHLLPDHHAPLRRFARSVPTNSSRTRASARVAQSKARKATAGGTWARSHTLSGKLEVVIPTRPPSMGRETLLQRWKNARQATDIYSTETREDQRLPLHAYKCRWENCSAELHNVTLLRMHMRKVHAEEMSEGTFTCLWADCRRTALTTLSGDAHGQTQRRDPLFFPTRGHWFQHVNSEHLEPYATKYGDGPLAHPVYCVPEIFTTEGEGVRDELSHPSPRVVQGRPKLHASTTRAPRIVASAPDTHDDDGLKSGVVEDIGSGTPPQAQAWEAVDSVAPSLPLPARRLISRLRARGALGGGLPVAVDSDGSVLIIEDVAS